MIKKKEGTPWFLKRRSGCVYSRGGGGELTLETRGEPAGLVQSVIWTPDVLRCSYIGGESAGLVLHMICAPDVLWCFCFEIPQRSITVGS